MINNQYNDSILKPLRLKVGDTVGLINPASALSSPEIVQIVKEQLAAVGLKVKPGVHLLDRYGYFAGRDEDRASDVNAMFRNPAVKGILAMRGGWGCNRILPLL